MIKRWLNKILHPPEYPSQTPNFKGKLIYWWKWHERCFDSGRGKVIGKFTMLIPEMGWAFTGLAFFGLVEPTPITLLWLFMIGSGSVWLLGWVYMMFNVDKVEAILTRQRDPMFKDIYNKMDSLGHKMNELKELIRK